MPQTLMLPSALSLPSADGLNDNAAEHGLGSAGQVQRFPHTRAQLSAIIRQHRSPLEGYDADDADDPNRVSTALVNRVASLLADEQEDTLKDLLKSECGVDDDMVGASPSCLVISINSVPARTACSRPHAQTSRRRGRRSVPVPHSNPTPVAALFQGIFSLCAAEQT